MKIFNICTKKTYEKDGETKVLWLRCGRLRETDDGKRFIEMNHQPETSFYCFEDKPKEKEKSKIVESMEDINWDN